METSQNTAELNSIEIASTIIEQIKYADRSALMAYGATCFAALSETEEFSGGVEFKVNGLAFVGWVKIGLRWADDYTISFISKDRELIHKVERVYCDMLVPVLDWVEGK